MKRPIKRTKEITKNSFNRKTDCKKERKNKDSLNGHTEKRNESKKSQESRFILHLISVLTQCHYIDIINITDNRHFGFVYLLG